MKTTFRAAIAIFLTVLAFGSFSRSLAQGRPDLVWMRGTWVDGQYSCAVSPDGKLLLTSGRYKTRLWRLSDGMLMRTLIRDTGFTAFNADGSLIAGAFNRVFRVWNAADGSLRLEVSGLSGNSTGIALSPDGTPAAIGLDNGTVEL